MRIASCHVLNFRVVILTVTTYKLHTGRLHNAPRFVDMNEDILSNDRYSNFIIGR